MTKDEIERIKKAREAFTTKDVQKKVGWGLFG
jgi:hypothetical protein